MSKCPECGFEELEPKKRVENNEVVEGGLYCPDCETEFKDDETLQWDDIDFPVWIEYEAYDDTFSLLRSFEYQTNLHRGDHDGTPGLRDFKYTVFCVWYKVEKDGTVTGPYANRGDEDTI